jgi:CO/xanthine dehydrogenase FAD-binding subunit
VTRRSGIGGLLAHDDPAADLPMALLALGGSVEAQGPGGTQRIAAEDFCQPLRDRAGAGRTADVGAGAAQSVRCVGG